VHRENVTRLKAAFQTTGYGTAFSTNEIAPTAEIKAGVAEPERPLPLIVYSLLELG